MNVIGHDHISPHADAKISCPPAVLDKARVHCGIGEQRRASVSIECYEVDRCIEALEKHIQSWWFIFEDSRHSNVVVPNILNAQVPRFWCCSVRCSQRMSSTRPELR